MSSHREAPGIAKDPVADSTDLYAFVSPDKPDTVTLIANYIPLQGPDGGPNFFEFGDDVVYEIHIDNDGDAHSDLVYRFTFRTDLTSAASASYLYNTGPITTLPSPNWSRPQTFTLTEIQINGARTTERVIGADLLVPPCNIGPLSTPDFGGLTAAAISYNQSKTGFPVYAGQRAEGFYVDLGAVFDLGDLRPFAAAHAGTTLTAMPGVNSTDQVNVHTLAIQVPITSLTKTGRAPSGVDDPAAVIGVWTTAKRRSASITHPETGVTTQSGPWRQVSRLGNPLFNELITPLAMKDAWNREHPYADAEYAPYVAKPALAGLLPQLYPGVFPNLGAYSGQRADLVAILLTGLPSGIVPGFQNFTGTTQADMLRLNVAVAPASSPSNLGILGGDLAGFPNGRRVFDDVATIELRAVAGATLPLVDPSFTPDAVVVNAPGAGGGLGFGLTSDPGDLTAQGTESYLTEFPYLATPHSGYNAHTSEAVA